MIDAVFIWAAWPLGIFALVQVLKTLPFFLDGGRLQGYVPALPMLIGALTGPWGAPWILTNAEGHALPPLVMSVVIGAGAGLCSQGIFDVYTRWVKTLVKAPET